MLRISPGRKAQALIISVAVSAGAIMAAPAQTTGPSYAIEGPGRTLCADFIATDADPGMDRDVAAWLSGYLTAHHRLLNEIYDLSPWQTSGVLVGLTRQYCDAHPEASVERGAQEVIRYLLPNALRESAEVVAMRNGENLVLLYAPVVGRVRDALTDAGFDPGISDDELAAAIEAFQQARSIPITGLPDQQTLINLLE